MKITITTDDESHFYAIPSEMMPLFRNYMEKMSHTDREEYPLLELVTQRTFDEFDELFGLYGFDLEKEFEVMD